VLDWLGVGLFYEKDGALGKGLLGRTRLLFGLDSAGNSLTESPLKGGGEEKAGELGRGEKKKTRG